MGVTHYELWFGPCRLCQNRFTALLSDRSRAFVVGVLRHCRLSHHVVIRLTVSLLFEMQERADAAYRSTLTSICGWTLDRIHGRLSQCAFDLDHGFFIILHIEGAQVKHAN